MTFSPRKQLLLVEDSPQDVELAQIALEFSKVRCELRVASDGQAALDYFAGQGTADLVLLDLNMPRVGGLEVLRRLKGDERWRHVPVVILTTSNAQNDRDACTALGADDYIVKPNDIQSFVKAVNALGTRWLGDALCEPSTGYTDSA